MVCPNGMEKLPGKWNDEWLKFMEKNPDATPSEIYQKCGQLMDRFGLSDCPIVPY
jgi:hypothetical protein